MARRLYVTGHEGDARRAEGIVRLCGRATEIDSNYARAWALLALGQVILRFLHGGKFDTGMAAAERALALDPTLAEAHAVKARVYSGLTVDMMPRPPKLMLPYVWIQSPTRSIDPLRICNIGGAPGRAMQLAI